MLIPPVPMPIIETINYFKQSMIEKQSSYKQSWNSGIKIRSKCHTNFNTVTFKACFIFNKTVYLNSVLIFPTYKKNEEGNISSKRVNIL